jgi:hypothetical protein
LFCNESPYSWQGRPLHDVRVAIKTTAMSKWQRKSIQLAGKSTARCAGGNQVHCDVQVAMKVHKAGRKVHCTMRWWQSSQLRCAGGNESPYIWQWSTQYDVAFARCGGQVLMTCSTGCCLGCMRFSPLFCFWMHASYKPLLS